MNAPWKLICLIASLILFAIATWGGIWPDPNPWWRRLIAAGLFFYILSLIIN
jgi:hypothetical protein